MPGPLQGTRIIELAGIGPGPFCGMLLADQGAEVIRVERIGGRTLPSDALARSRRSIAIDLKNPRGVELVGRLTARADGFIEGFRPGVMERLGLGPDELLAGNPRLVYGRMTGWGQTGPWAQAAGHDINYIALSGALHTCGRRGGQPTPPVNYLGDFGGGGMLLAFGMVSAMLAVRNGAPGQVVDCAMTDGSALLMAMTWSFYATGAWRDEAGVNLLDSGAHFYDTYETSDGKWVSIGSIEPQFYALLRDKLGLAGDEDFDDHFNGANWPGLKKRLAGIFRTKTRAEWCELMGAGDVCFAPVLSLAEAPQHPHNAARETYVTVGGAVQPAPAPRFSATPAEAPRSAPAVGRDTDAVLSDLGIDAADRAELRSAGVVA